MFGHMDQLALYGDRTFGALTPAHARAYPSDTELDLYLTQDDLRYSRRPSAAILNLQDPTLTCNRNLGWNIDWAVAFLIDHLKAVDAADDFRAIRKRAADLESAGLIQEVPYRIFNRLDEVLFAGHLRNAIFLDMGRLELDVSGVTYNPGWGPEKEIKRISIVLNGNAIEVGTAKDIVAILIHQMIHAYFLVACGPQKEDEVDYGRLGHGVHFGKILLAIKKLSAVHGKELSALGFKHRSRKSHYSEDDFYSRFDNAIAEHQEYGEWYCSHCHDSVEELSTSEVDRWYKKVCKPMSDQRLSVRSPKVHVYNDRRNELRLKRRAQLQPSAKSVEFIFKDKFVLVENKMLEDLIYVRKAFERVESRYLKIEEFASEATFLRFLEFVYTGSYHPDPAPFAAFSSGHGLGRKGPPVIKPQASLSSSPLLADVEFARFANLMEFHECHQYALGRMNAYGALYEDPVIILEAIYHGREPDPNLKAWAREFLVKAPTAPSPGLNTDRLESPNLLKLEQESGAYRARFIEAMENSGALENDVNKARTELGVLGWYTRSLIPHNTLDLLATAPYGIHPLTPLHARSPHLLTDAYTSPIPVPSTPYHHAPSLSSADIERLCDYERLKEKERCRERERSRTRDKKRELERTRLKLLELERDVDRESESERDKRKDERRRYEEVKVQAYTVALLEKLAGKRRGGFVESDGEGFE